MWKIEFDYGAENPLEAEAVHEDVADTLRDYREETRFEAREVVVTRNIQAAMALRLRFDDHIRRIDILEDA